MKWQEVWNKRSEGRKVGPFVVYENPIYGISIQYPDNWHKSENNLPSHGVVKFSAPDVKEKESKHSISIFIPAFLVVPANPSTISSSCNQKSMPKVSS